MDNNKGTVKSDHDGAIGISYYKKLFQSLASYKPMAEWLVIL